MMNQNVQTNRHGPQNKGYNQASIALLGKQASLTMPIGLNERHAGRSVMSGILEVYLSVKKKSNHFLNQNIF